MSKSIFRSSALTAIISIAFLAAPASASATPRGWYDEVLLSGPSALSVQDAEPGGCAWDALGDLRPLEADLDYESTIAVDPKDRRQMATVWLADDGLTVQAATSLDAGQTWTQEALPRATTCNGGTHRTSYDVRVAIGTASDGSSRAYAVFTSQNQPFPDPRATVTTVNVSTNDFDGTGWSDPVVVDATGSIDFPVVTTDPSAPGTAYVMWSKRFDATMFSATTDGGQTWTTPSLVRISSPGTLSLGELTTAADGTLVNSFVETPATVLADPSVLSNMYVSRSADSGRSWSEPELVASDVTGGFGLTSHEKATHFTWTSGEKVMVRTQNGREWAATTRVSGSDPAELPGISVTSDGTVGVLFYEAAAPSSDGSRPGTIALAVSTDGGHSWTHSRPSQGFDRAKIPFIGDHASIAASACGFVTSWTGGADRATYGRSDIFFSSFDLPRSPKGRCDRIRDRAAAMHGV
jgi:hypothetical protein